MTRPRRPSPRVRAALLVGLTVLLVGAGSTAGHALWASTATTSANVTSASVAVTESGFDTLAGELTAQSPSRTATVIVTNTGSTRDSWTATMTTPTTVQADVDFARNVRVVAWSTTASSCTASTAIPSGSATGNWPFPPSLSGTLAAGAKATWCVRTTATAFPTSSAASVTATLTTVLGTSSWKGRDSSSARQTSPVPAVTGGFSCQPTDGNWYVIISWDVSKAPLDTWYSVIVNGKTIAMSQGSYGKATISANQLPASVAADGTVKVRIDRLDANDQSVGQVAGGTIVAFTQSGARGFRCA